MSNFESFLDNLPDFAKDIKLNAKSIILGESSSLSPKQTAIISVACAIASKDLKIREMVIEHFSQSLTETEMNGAKAAAAIMGMNNIYYRFLHLTINQEYQNLPVGLRMSVIANSGLETIDFELASLAVSAITGCGMCMDSHEKKLKSHAVTVSAIQASVKIAAIINSLSSVAI